MAANSHYRRLENIYASNQSDVATANVAVSYGHAELRSHLNSVADAGLRESPEQTLLRDAASLAAGSLEKEHVVNAEQFNVEVANEEYTGPIVANARVVVAHPPRFVVKAVLVTPEGDLIAEATGVYKPGQRTLPEDPSPGTATAENKETPPPATFMPVFQSPFGPICLN